MFMFKNHKSKVLFRSLYMHSGFLQIWAFSHNILDLENLLCTTKSCMYLGLYQIEFAVLAQAARAGVDMMVIFYCF